MYAATVRIYYHAVSVHDCRDKQDDDWSYTKSQAVDGDEIGFVCLVDNNLWMAN